jgi:hypothetical protein
MGRPAPHRGDHPPWSLPVQTSPVTPNEARPLGTWASVEPSAASSILAAVPSPWWIAGGWAIDLFVGRQTRSHGDLDVQVLRRDLDGVLAALPGWDIRVAKDGSLRELNGPLDADAFCLWCRPDPDGPWMLELLVADTSGDRWIFRRDPTISVPISEIGLVTPEGIPYLAPEIQLLFKAKAPRSEDEQDFENALPFLDAGRIRWLTSVMHTIEPSHQWIERANGPVSRG